MGRNVLKTIFKARPKDEPIIPDYILFLRKNYPIAVVEAKADYKQPGDGLQLTLTVCGKASMMVSSRRIACSV